MTNYLIVAVIGALVGLGELVSRFRDRPLSIFSAAGGWVYIAVNASASAVALLLVRKLGWDFGQKGNRVELFQVLGSAFGAMAILRSTLFVAKIGDQDVSIGPSVVIASLLGVADRGVDRRQAKHRNEKVAEIMKDIDYQKACEGLAATCVKASVSYPSDAASRLGNTIAALSQNTTMTNRIKTHNLGLTLVNEFGLEILASSVKALGNNITEGPLPPPPVAHQRTSTLRTSARTPAVGED